MGDAKYWVEYIGFHTMYYDSNTGLYMINEYENEQI